MPQSKTNKKVGKSKEGQKKTKKTKKNKIKVDFNNLMPAGVKIIRSYAGLGLAAKEPIKRGDFVIEYVGKILTTKEAENHLGKYLFEVNSKWTIDGATRTNTARYINHSCKPNCEVEIKKERVLIFAKRDIAVGEELSYDYGKEYVDEFIKPYGCRCGKCKPAKVKK
jgi:SET domain-containing protein